MELEIVYWELYLTKYYDYVFASLYLLYNKAEKYVRLKALIYGTTRQNSKIQKIGNNYSIIFTFMRKISQAKIVTKYKKKYPLSNSLKTISLFLVWHRYIRLKMFYFDFLSVCPLIQESLLNSWRDVDEILHSYNQYHKLTYT